MNCKRPATSSSLAEVSGDFTAWFYGKIGGGTFIEESLEEIRDILSWAVSIPVGASLFWIFIGLPNLTTLSETSF